MIVMVLPKFTQAIKPHADKLPAGTLWRYANGKLPGFGRLLLKYPELAAALAEDAAQLAGEKNNAQKGGDQLGDTA